MTLNVDTSTINMPARSSPRPRIFVAIPSGGANRVNGLALPAINEHADVVFFNISGSAASWNRCLALALDLRDEDKIDHMMILHEDILPKRNDWSKVLWDEYEKHDADMMSAVVPIKDKRAVTSTAVETKNPWGPHRYTMREVMAGPVTWTHPEMLLNTGMILINLRRPWLDEYEKRGLCFTCENVMVKHPDTGKRQVGFFSEDWLFCRHARMCGATKLYATRAVPLSHIGSWNYDNDSAWGLEHDVGDFYAEAS